MQAVFYFRTASWQKTSSLRLMDCCRKTRHIRETACSMLLSSPRAHSTRGERVDTDMVGIDMWPANEESTTNCSVSDVRIPQPPTARRHASQSVVSHRTNPSTSLSSSQHWSVTTAAEEEAGGGWEGVGGGGGGDCAEGLKRNAVRTYIRVKTARLQADTGTSEYRRRHSYMSQNDTAW